MTVAHARRLLGAEAVGKSDEDIRALIDAAHDAARLLLFLAKRPAWQERVAAAIRADREGR